MKIKIYKNNTLNYLNKNRNFKMKYKNEKKNNNN